jgi:hypothetical protein
MTGPTCASRASASGSSSLRTSGARRGPWPQEVRTGRSPVLRLRGSLLVPRPRRVCPGQWCLAGCGDGLAPVPRHREDDRLRRRAVRNKPQPVKFLWRGTSGSAGSAYRGGNATTTTE